MKIIPIKNADVQVTAAPTSLQVGPQGPIFSLPGIAEPTIISGRWYVEEATNFTTVTLSASRAGILDQFVSVTWPSGNDTLTLLAGLYSATKTIPISLVEGDYVYLTAFSTIVETYIGNSPYASGAEDLVVEFH